MLFAYCKQAQAAAGYSLLALFLSGGATWTGQTTTAGRFVVTGTIQLTAKSCARRAVIVVRNTGSVTAATQLAASVSVYRGAKQNWEKTMARVEPLSIDIRGRWSQRQARAIIDRLRFELHERQLGLSTIDVTTHADQAVRVIFAVWCTKHECIIAEDSACELCVLNAPAAPVDRVLRERDYCENDNCGHHRSYHKNRAGKCQVGERTVDPCHCSQYGEA